MDANSILKWAMLTEWDGLHFYSRAAKAMSDLQGKRMLQTLIADERVHVGVIANEYDALNSGKGWLALADAKKECRLPDVAKKFKVKPGETCEGLQRIFPVDAAADELIRSVGTDTAVLELAKRFETRGFHAYKEAAQQLDDPKGKQLLNWLAEQEESHYKLLDSAAEYLNRNGLWWDHEYMVPLEG
jgi:rubrerythrin